MLLMTEEVDVSIEIIKDVGLMMALETAAAQDQTITLATAILLNIIRSIMIVMQLLMPPLLAIG